MNYLLDTHILIWSLISPHKLKKNVQNILKDGSNNIFLSQINLWEISMKYATGKLLLNNLVPEDFLTVAVQSGFAVKELSAKEAATYYKLTANHHKDPFDRMLIWQAMQNNYTLISDDEQVKRYQTDGLKVL